MKCRIRLSNTCLVALSLCGLWATNAHAQDAPVVNSADSPVDETSSTIGQDHLNLEQAPHLDPDRPIVCVENDAGEQLRIQCDDAAKRCLVAKPHLEIPGAREQVVARMMQPCQPAEPGALERLKSAGYEMVPARLETRHGYKRDERGRIYQTHFDLRRRFFMGVYDTMTIASDGSQIDHRLSAEIGGVFEEYDDTTRRRDRHQIARGKITLDPVEVEGLLYGYDRGRTGDEPVFRFVEFVTPEPDRYDIAIHLGPGARLGRFSYEEIDGRGIALIDALQGHINWEIAQNDEQGLEDYLLIRGGLGGGFLSMEGQEENPAYFYPELGVEGAWLIDDRGLTQLRMEAAYRHLWDNEGDERDRASAEVSLERVILSINDQPLTVFAQGGVDYKSGPLAPDGLTSFEALLGGRMSFFVPPPPNYEAE
jgi:hypothetical protein